MHDAPDAAGLVEAVREYLERDVMAATEGRVQFHARIAARVLAMVERELRFGGRLEAEHEQRLAELGFQTDEDLARAIREGSLDDRYPEVKAAVRAGVVDKLVVANPRYLRPEDQPSEQGVGNGAVQEA